LALDFELAGRSEAEADAVTVDVEHYHLYVFADRYNFAGAAGEYEHRCNLLRECIGGIVLSNKHHRVSTLLCLYGRAQGPYMRARC
jgi:hypothetical protein